MIIEVFILLLAFQVKHLIADYYLQFPYMYENKGKPYFFDWFRPLLDHAGVHALFTLIVVSLFILNVAPDISTRIAFAIIGSVTLFDFVTHFVTDRWKATQKTDPSKAWFWQSLGIDQMIHHVVGIIIVFVVVVLT